MAILLSDAGRAQRLRPFTYTRPIGALRPGVHSFAEAWHAMTEMPVGYRSEPYLTAKYPEVEGEVVFEVYGGILPTPEFVTAVLDLQPGEVLVHNDTALAFCERGSGKAAIGDWSMPPSYLKSREFTGDLVGYDRPWHFFQLCGRAIINDFALLSDGRRSAALSALNTLIGDPALLFIEEGASVEACVFNTTQGPIYIGKGAEVMEGSLIRGPFALGEGAVVKMGAKIYGATAIGPGCRVGGEVSNSLMMGFSNKGHDGFLGNSVLGEWCNLGADTNTSNLKNTYGNVQIWDPVERAQVDTGLQFCGLMMGDHGRAGINTMFNTGTFAGPYANVFDGGFPPKHIPSFFWGGANSSAVYDPEKAINNAARMMQRRGIGFTPEDEAILRHVFADTADDRS